MCLILLGWQAHASTRLVLAANRDEFFARAADPAHAWPDAPQVLAGRDRSGGGTWLGITRQGRLAALTNVRDPAHMRSDRPSRGHLVADFLRGQQRPDEYLDAVAARGDAYNGFNLVIGDVYGEQPALHWYSNVERKRVALPPGIHGLSNAGLNTSWPKLQAGRAAMQHALAADAVALDGLATALGDERIYPDPELPATGVPLAWERALSAAHIRTPAYGTRCTTLLTASADGTIAFDEQTWLAGSGVASPRGIGPRRRFRFAVAF